MLAGGFGLGVAVMANLLGVAEVVLEQSQSPALVGGGDVVVTRRGQPADERPVSALGRARRAGVRGPHRGGVAHQAGQRLPRAGRRGHAAAGPRRHPEPGARARGSGDRRRQRVGGRAGRCRVDLARPGGRAPLARSLPRHPRRARARRIVGRVALLQRPGGLDALLPDVPRRARSARTDDGRRA